MRTIVGLVGANGLLKNTVLSIQLGKDPFQLPLAMWELRLGVIIARKFNLQKDIPTVVKKRKIETHK